MYVAVIRRMLLYLLSRLTKMYVVVIPPNKNVWIYCGTDVPEYRLQNDCNFILIGFFICGAILGLYNKMVKTPLKEHCRSIVHAIIQ